MFQWAGRGHLLLIMKGIPNILRATLWCLESADGQDRVNSGGSPLEKKIISRLGRKDARRMKRQKNQSGRFLGQQVS